MDRDVESRYDKIAKEYQKTLTDFGYFKKITSKFCSRIKGKILDVGCGNGFITCLISGKNKQVIGIDISREMIKEAQRLQPAIKFMQMNMNYLKFKDDSFDGLFCFQAFQHISPAQQDVVFSEFYRVLSKNSLLMFNTNNKFYYKTFLLALFSKIKHPDAKFGEIEIGGKTKTYRYLSSLKDLKKKLTNHGFQIMKYESNIFSKWIQIWAVKNMFKP